MVFEGEWNIYEMDMWDEDYFNMEVQAYISIDLNCSGHFQFGLVTGDFRGKLSTINGEEIFKFTFRGVDEMDETSGAGWIKSTSINNIKGEFEFYEGDSSEFYAIRKK